MDSGALTPAFYSSIAWIGEVLLGVVVASGISCTSRVCRSRHELEARYRQADRCDLLLAREGSISHTYFLNMFALWLLVVASGFCRILDTYPTWGLSVTVSGLWGASPEDVSGMAAGYLVLEVVILILAAVYLIMEWQYLLRWKARRCSHPDLLVEEYGTR